MAAIREELASSASQPLRAGHRIDHYEIESFIARGGFGAVYCAIDLEHQRRVALKVLHPELALSSQALLRFAREANALAILEHENIASVYEFCALKNGRSYMAMELLSGRSLAEFLESRGALSPGRVLSILLPICDALSAAHDQGFVHRDIKPSNIFLCDDGRSERAVLLDFGLAKLLDQESFENTGPVFIVGTPVSMAPEQARCQEITPATDVYSLAAMTHRMLCGASPFASICREEFPFGPDDSWRPPSTALGAGIDEVLGRGMSMDPCERQATPREFMQALSGAIAHLLAAEGQQRPSEASPAEPTDSAEIAYTRTLHAQAMASLGRQFAEMIHDCRSPLCVISGNLEIITSRLNSGVLTPTIKSAMSDAKSAAAHLGKLVTQTMRAATESSYREPKEPVSLISVVDSAVTLSKAATRPRARLSVNHSGNAWVAGSSTQLVQVVVNLLINAAQAMSEYGQIELTTRATPAGRVEIAISDSGSGIPEDVRERIFEPFYSTKNASDGSGLGLGLVREIVEDHGGTIDLDSTVGVGTCFVIDLPGVVPQPLG